MGSWESSKIEHSPTRHLESNDEGQTVEIGRKLGESLKPPRVVCLVGDLGTGKTVLTRGLVEGLGGDGREVSSPTFTLVNQYDSKRGPVYHLDLYRLDSLRDLYSIGIEDILGEDAIVIVEWAEKLTLPLDHPLRIHIRAEGERRIFEIVG